MMMSSLRRAFFPKHALVLALAVVGLCACATQPKAPPPPPDPASQMPALEARIMAIVETERMKIAPKAKMLTPDPELSKVARGRARDMAAKHYLAHAAPDGETSATLLMAQDADFQGLLGENLAAQHYTKQQGISVEAFAKKGFCSVYGEQHPDHYAVGVPMGRLRDGELIVFNAVIPRFRASRQSVEEGLAPRLVEMVAQVRRSSYAV